MLFTYDGIIHEIGFYEVNFISKNINKIFERTYRGKAANFNFVKCICKSSISKYFVHNWQLSVEAVNSMQGSQGFFNLPE